jgi:hypothetical protein
MYEGEEICEMVILDLHGTRKLRPGWVSVICSDGKTITIPKDNYFRHIARIQTDTRWRADWWAMFEESCRDAEYLRQLYGENGHIDGYI